MDNNDRNRALVLGGTGKTGRRVVERLTALGRPVRIGSRAGQPPFDWHDETSWTGARRDVDSVYVSYYPDVAFPGAADTIGSFATAAVDLGIRRVRVVPNRRDVVR